MGRRLRPRDLIFTPRANLMPVLHVSTATTYVYPRGRTALQLETLKLKIAAGKEWSSMVLHPHVILRLTTVSSKLNSATKREVEKTSQQPSIEHRQFDMYVPVGPTSEPPSPFFYS